MTLSALLDQARRRVLTHLLFDKGALAATAGLAGAVLLLLAGTQILDWYWVVGLVAIGLGVGVYQMRKDVPSRYQLAQRIDRRLELADTLSTATYFSEHPKPGYEAVCAVQRRAAEGLAGRVDLQAALPLERSRYLYPALGLLLVAAGLFALRFAVLGRLDLKPSLLEIAVDTFLAAPAEQAHLKAPRANLTPQAFDPEQLDAPGSQDDPRFQIPEDAGEPDDLLKGDGKQEASGKNGENKEGLKEKGGEEGDPQGDPQAKQTDKEGDREDGQDPSEDSQDQRSVLDKLRDAVENLLNKMNPKEGNARNLNRQQKGQKGEKGQKGDEKGESSEGEPQMDSGEQGQQSEEQDAKNAQSPGQKRPDQNAKSGAGENEGEKAIQDAAMLEAMGKLTELIGQRANEISGQVMIEVGNTRQQLRTAFTQQQSGHGEAGSEIHRDEIPLVHQPFIERYFQEVRKGTQAPAKDAGK